MLGYSAGGRNPTARAGPMLSYLQAPKALSLFRPLATILMSNPSYFIDTTRTSGQFPTKSCRVVLCAHGESTDSVRPQESDGARRLGTDGIDNVCRVVLE